MAVAKNLIQAPPQHRNPAIKADSVRIWFRKTSRLVWKPSNEGESTESCFSS